MKPVWDGYLADPFILPTSAGFFAYGTDGPNQEVLRQTGRAFPILHSVDLLRWELIGGALDSPYRLHALHYWAPEVCEYGGRFYMFYSTGGEEGEAQRLRVATADRPEGPFVDAADLLLPDEPFSIDASPFQDPCTGDWWLFFAKDFLNSERPGTGCAVVKLNPGFRSVSGDRLPVVLPSADWQVYERNRHWYGRVWPAWYTVEGPCCVYRQGRYWLFFSGGRWKSENYGVGVAVADAVTGPYVQREGAAVLNCQSGLRGPGHNSIFVGLDGVDRIVFHAWNEEYTKRQMYVEPLLWTPAGPVLG